MSAAIESELTCKELVELVTEYLEDRLSLTEHRRFELHVCTCTGCREYLAQMRAVVRATGRLGEGDLVPGVRQELLQAFRSWRAGKRS